MTNLREPTGSRSLSRPTETSGLKTTSPVNTLYVHKLSTCSNSRQVKAPYPHEPLRLIITGCDNQGSCPDDQDHQGLGRRGVEGLTCRVHQPLVVVTYRCPFGEQPRVSVPGFHRLMGRPPPCPSAWRASGQPSCVDLAQLLTAATRQVRLLSAGQTTMCPGSYPGPNCESGLGHEPSPPRYAVAALEHGQAIEHRITGVSRVKRSRTSVGSPLASLINDHGGAKPLLPMSNHLLSGINHILTPSSTSPG